MNATKPAIRSRRKVLATLILASLATAWALGAQAVAAAGKNAPAADTPSLVGLQIDITLVTNETLSNVKVIRVRTGTRVPGSIAVVTIADKDTGKPVVLKAVRIREICEPGGKPLLIYDPKCKMLMPPDQASAKAQTDPQGDTSVRLSLSNEDQKAAVEKQRAFLLEAGQKMPSRGMQLQETKRFLFYSDVPAQIVAMYVSYLDAMYMQLCKIYGIDPNVNIWKGKATVVVFADGANFSNFQRTYFHDPGMEGVAGLANLRSDGEVVITAHAMHDAKFFAVVLVHETTHGFTFRYFAKQHVPSWLHEGISEYVANQVVPGNTEIRRRVEESIDMMRRTRSLGREFFTAQQIEAEQYGTATAFVNFLLMFNPKASTGKPTSRSRRQEPAPLCFRQFQEKLRAGTTWQQSLQEAYGMTLPELVQRFGMSLGIPNLQP